MQTVSAKDMAMIKTILGRIVEQRRVTRHEHRQLTSLLLSAHNLSPEERTQINRVFDYLQSGQLKLVD